MRPLYSINAFATESGRDRSVFVRALRDTPPDSKARGQARFYLSTIIDALLADAKAGASADGGPTLTDARTRKALADAESAERQNRIDAGKWVKFDDAVKWMHTVLITCRERLLGLSGELGDVLDVDQRALVDSKVRDALTELGNPEEFIKLSTTYQR